MKIQHQASEIRSCDTQPAPTLRNCALPLFQDVKSLNQEVLNFLIACHTKHGLIVEEWTSYLVNWARALNAFGTPESFLDPLIVNDAQFENYPCVSLASFHGRIASMKMLLDAHRYTPTEDQLQQFNLSQEEFLACGGCQSVMAVEARMTESLISSGLVSPHYQFLHIANAYPFEPGGSMIFENRHDHLVNRQKENETGIYKFQEGKTFDAILTFDFVLSAFTCADAHNLAGIRNHTVTGKSVGYHDHFQLFPSDLRKAGLLRHVNESPEYTHDFSGKVLYRTSNFSIFDTMVVSSTDVFELANAVTELGEKLERAGIPFTLAYYNGHCLVGPCKKLPEYTKSSLGARAVLHYFLEYSKPGGSEIYNELENIEDLFTFLPRPGEFKWEEFIPKE